MDNQQRYIEIEGQQIPVTEEVYRAYKRPAWAEHKRQERAKRCRDENGNRCIKDCRLCEKSREGSTFLTAYFDQECKSASANGTVTLHSCTRIQQVQLILQILPRALSKTIK